MTHNMITTYGHKRPSGVQGVPRVQGVQGISEAVAREMARRWQAPGILKDGKLTTSSTIHGHICYLKTTYGFPDFKPHELRHTHCTKLLSNGVDVKYVQKRLGHKSIQTTLDIYHHLTKNIALSEDSKLDNLF